MDTFYTYSIHAVLPPFYKKIWDLIVPNLYVCYYDVNMMLQLAVQSSKIANLAQIGNFGSQIGFGDF